MCPFENGYRVLACDAALHQVREAVSTVFGDAVQVTPVAEQGTWVEIPASEDATAFQAVARAAIAAAQEQLTTPPDQEREEREVTKSRWIWEGWPGPSSQLARVNRMALGKRERERGA